MESRGLYILQHDIGDPIRAGSLEGQECHDVPVNLLFINGERVIQGLRIEEVGWHGEKGWSLGEE